MYYGVPKKHEKSNQPLQISKVTTARNHKSAEKERERVRDLTSGLMQILRTNCKPHIPRAANSGYTYKYNASMHTIKNSYNINMHKN